MKKILSAVGISSLVYLLPIVVFAQQYGGLDNVAQFFNNIIAFINKTLVPLIFAIAFLVFLWGVFKAFILGGADETKRSEGRQLMLYAIIGFLLMVSLWGIVNLLSTGFGFGGQENTVQLPKAPGGK